MDNQRMRGFAAGVAVFLAMTIAAVAQEPLPVHLQPTNFDRDGRVTLQFAWRYAPGDGPGRELPACDDSRWTAVRPALLKGELPPDWRGVGWFRRHLLLAPDLQSKTLELGIEAPGTAQVYLDGRRILTVGENGAPRAISMMRSDAVLVRLEGPVHLLAVRYVYPLPSPGSQPGIGFLVSISNLRGTALAARPQWAVALRGAILALPVFLALLHLALFAFDRRARENLFYALEMMAFALIVFGEYREVFIGSPVQRDLIDRIGDGLPSLAILFGGLTYYAVRSRPWPRSWRVFTAAGVALYAMSFFERSHHLHYGWVAYFALLLVEIVRVERSSTVVKRAASRIFLIGFAVFGFVIFLQILVNFEVIESVAGVREVYVIGIVVSAIGMSLYLASNLGQSRIHEAESRRKTEELTTARELQLSMLPREMPAAAGLDIAASTVTAAEVGGDYYDVRASDGESLLFAFGDATGHGLAAGIVVTAAKALFTSLTAAEPPSQLLSKCDRAMAAMHLPALRMCLSLASVSRDRVTVASAAMPPLLVHRAASGNVDELGAGGLPLGSRIAARYEERSTALAAGDTILFASDGFAEVTSAHEGQLGYDAAVEAFRRCAAAPTAKGVIERLFDEVTAFRGTSPQTDDITFLAVRIREP